MNFALSAKYLEIDFEVMGLSDLMLVGGGCGGGGGGGGSTTITSAQVQAAAQRAASIAGTSASNCSIVDLTSAGSYHAICWDYRTNTGAFISEAGSVNSTTGSVTSSSSGGFWSSMGSFFSWLFGSH